VDLSVRSTATGAPIDVRVLPAPRPDAPAPVLYLLNGAAGGGDGSNWFDRTDIRAFFADKQVTIVVPSGGAASFFTDWERADPVLGRQKWATFLTRELPPLIDAVFHGSGRNAIAGISMAGTSAFQLPLAAPGLYRAAAAYSACATTSDPVGRAFVNAIVEGRGHGNTVNMWGPPGDPAWAANDPYRNAARLRGLAIYESNGTGAPGPLDTLTGPGIQGDPVKLVDQLVVGAVIETATNRCAHAFQRRLAALGVPATFVFRPYGTHSWGYWQHDLHDSWTRVIGPALS
jgi:diacylglycerol O-acyltransferase / trehalose O-mycolyltransferase